MDTSQKMTIAEKILEYGGKQGFAKTIEFTPDKEANDLILNNSFAYLIAVICDQGMKAERVWAIPFELQKRLGHLDPEKIAKLSDEDIEGVFRTKPTLHRYWKTMAKRVKSACKLVDEKYDGNAENIWNDNPRSDDLHRRFEEFDGIGQKKASMATNILVRDLGADVKDKKWIDVSYDIHVRRVFLRTELVEKDDQQLIIQTARALNPEYPGKLDLPCWLIGRNWCHPNNPDCTNCPITSVCPKMTTYRTWNKSYNIF